MSDESNFKILHYLNELISRNVIIKNKYEIDCFLREINNEYFLIDDGNFNADPLLSFYSKYPSLSDEATYAEAMAVQYKKFSTGIISKIFSEKEPMFYMKKLYPIDQQYVLEACVLLNHTRPQNLIPKSVKKILDHNKYFWIEKEGYFLVILANFIDKTNKVSYMKKTRPEGEEEYKWERGDHVDELYKNYIKTIKDKDFYGLITIVNETEKLKLVNRTKEYNKKNKNITTQVCETLHKDSIKKLILEHIKPRDLIVSNNNFIELKDIETEDDKYDLKTLQHLIIDKNKKLVCKILENYLRWSGNILTESTL